MFPLPYRQRRASRNMDSWQRDLEQASLVRILESRADGGVPNEPSFSTAARFERGTEKRGSHTEAQRHRGTEAQRHRGAEAQGNRSALPEEHLGLWVRFFASTLPLPAGGVLVPSALTSDTLCTPRRNGASFSRAFRGSRHPRVPTLPGDSSHQDRSRPRPTAARSRPKRAVGERVRR